MMQFSLSRLWKNVDEEIQIGLVQSLVVRMGKLRNINTSEMKLYESFIKGLSKYARKHIYDPQLEESFNRVNDAFFSGGMEKSNLIFASESFHKLGSYEYGTDTVYISTIFKDLPIDEQKFLDYVMYHELLHKKHTFNVKNGRHRAHTTAFRTDEKKFGPESEEELNKWLRRKKYSLKRMFKMW
jgi:predicted metal-dependent hydrolase